MNLDYTKDFTQEEIDYLKTLSDEELETQLKACDKSRKLSNTNQINRKLAINSAYGAIGQVNFRYYDLRNAEAITIFGQLVLQWQERRLNEYLNQLAGTTNHSFVIYGDTDSLYLELTPIVNKIGLERFKTTDELVTFLDNLASKKLEPHISKGFIELCEYFNNYKQLMAMDREAIVCPPLGSNGIGGFFKAKKRYALSVYDMEGTRYTVPKLKIMGLETQQSSTPKFVQAGLKESIRLLLQEGEASLQSYFKEIQDQHKSMSYKVLAEVKTANNIQKYNDKGFPGFKCPFHIRGVLTYNRAIANFKDAPTISEGEKIMILPLRSGNPFGDKCISWPSGTEIYSGIRADVLKWIDYPDLFQKTYMKPMTSICDIAKVQLEKRASLEDLFSF